jgi:hypothetical protein
LTIYARRYHWADMHPYENTALLDAFVAQPEFLTYPHSPEDARKVGAHILTDPGNVIWASYCNRELTGIILLQRVILRVDALMHFLFIDKDLVSKRKLLNNLIGVCFTDYGFNRLSMEVPEGVRIERFCRKVLGFRYEGESRPRNPELPTALTDNWVARQGSRIEQGHFNGTEWKDVLRLRLLASEWVGERGEETCQSEQSQGPPHQ